MGQTNTTYTTQVKTEDTPSTGFKFKYQGKLQLNCTSWVCNRVTIVWTCPGGHWFRIAVQCPRLEGLLHLVPGWRTRRSKSLKHAS